MQTRSRQSAFSLIELVVVLAIVGILAITAGVFSFQPRHKPAVQNLLNEVEGLISESHKAAGATLGNIVVEGVGSWGAKTLELNFQTKLAPGVPVSRIRADSAQDWQYAGIDTGGGMATAVGGETLEAALAGSTPDLLNDLTAALGRNLFAVGGKVELNAFNKQFMTGFHIPVVGLRDGVTFAGAPAGVVVVSGNRIYKFYKAGPGPENPWRRL